MFRRGDPETVGLRTTEHYYVCWPVGEGGGGDWGSGLEVLRVWGCGREGVGEGEGEGC